MSIQPALQTMDRLRKEKRFLILYTFAGIIIYYTLISKGLFNHYDGLWHPSRYYAGEWEVSIGRWIVPLVDKARFGLVSAPMNTLISLLLTGIGHILLFDLFGLKNDAGKLLVSLLWIGSCVFCMTLSYLFTSPAYAVAFLFAAASAYTLIRQNNWGGLLLSACFFALTMGSYQGYIGVTCLILCAYFIVFCSRTEKVADIAKYCLRVAGMILCGGIFYLIGTKIITRITKISLDEYGGAASITPAVILRNLPQGVKLCYTEFYKFFATSSRHNNYFKENHCTVLLFAVLMVIMAVCVFKVLQKNVPGAVMMVIGAALLPLAANFVVLIAVGSTYIQLQTASGMAMMPGVLICMTYAAAAEHADAANVRKSKSYLLKATAVTVLTVLLAWSEICSVTNDQLAMEEGRTSVTTIANMVAKDLKDEGLITAEEKICIFGLPAMNKLFYKYQAWEEANNYAKFGRWSVAPGCDFYSWRSTYRYLCGLSLNFCSRGEYYELKDMDEVKKMPTYPEQGSIRKIGEFIVVKVSDKY